MSSVLAKEAMTATFEDLRLMILDIVHSFCRRYRTEFEETESMAYEAFVDSFGNYDAKRGSFQNHVYQKVLSKLYEAHRTFMRRVILGRITDADPSLCPNPQDDFWLFEFLDSLSEDAREVAKLTIDSPKEVVLAIMTKGDSFAIRRTAISQFLRDCGWAADRIAESFAEVGEALR